MVRPRAARTCFETDKWIKGIPAKSPTKAVYAIFLLSTKNVKNLALLG